MRTETRTFVYAHELKVGDWFQYLDDEGVFHCVMDIEIDYRNCTRILSVPSYSNYTETSTNWHDAKIEFELLGSDRLPQWPKLTKGYMTDSGHLFYAIVRTDRSFKILAGCRNFTAEQALRHWGSPKYHRGPTASAVRVKIVRQLIAEAKKLAGKAKKKAAPKRKAAKKVKRRR